MQPFLLNIKNKSVENVALNKALAAKVAINSSFIIPIPIIGDIDSTTKKKMRYGLVRIFIGFFFL